MKPLGKFLVCLLALGVGSCKKNAEITDHEVQEAGYSMTQEGWLKAIRADHLTVVKKMSKSGFDLKARDEKGQLSLHIAAEAGSENVAEFLLDAGISINVADNEGRTPLMLSVLSGKAICIKLAATPCSRLKSFSQCSATSSPSRTSRTTRTSATSLTMRCMGLRMNKRIDLFLTQNLFSKRRSNI